MVRKPWLVAFVLLALGCSTHSRVAEHLGEAQEALVARQVQNPEAEHAPAEPVEGLDPLTAESVVGKYEDTQGETHEPSRMPSIIQIDTGSSR